MSAKAISGFVVFGAVLLISLLATVLNVHESKGPREKIFVAKACIGAWALMISLLVLMYFLRSPWCYLVFAIYLVIFPLAIYRWATLHQLIRYIDEREANEKQPSDG